MCSISKQSKNDLYALYSTGVGTMWKELNHAQDATLLENFESFLTEVITELKQSDLEKSTLQTHVKRSAKKEEGEIDALLYLCVYVSLSVCMHAG